MKNLVILTCFLVLASCNTKTEIQIEYGSNSTVGKYMDVNDIKIYYEVYGEGEPLLLLHVNSGSIENFIYNIPELSKHFKVIAIDSRAQGRSYDSDKEITYALMASDMSELIDKLNLGKVNVVGWSDGGNIGLELAFAHPEKLLKVVAFGANYTHENWMAPADSVTMASDDPLWERTSIIMNKYKTTFDRLSPNKEKIPGIRKKLEDLMANYPNFTIDQLKTIKVPFLIVAGDHDVINLDQTIAMFTNLTQAQLLIVPGASHFVPVEFPDLANSEIIKFLKAPYRDIDRYYFFKE
jgi:pimeloyl-ACP methyl ester carboxylesterase